MASATIQISLPESLTPFVEAQVESGAYGTPSDYIRDLILHDRDRSLEALEARLLQNLDSRPIAFTQEELSGGDFLKLCRTKLRDIK
jgi:antitoxin ParD1/3/4